MKWIDNNRVGSLADLGHLCTIRLCKNRYLIVDWRKDEDGEGYYFLNAFDTDCEMDRGWEPVKICTISKDVWITIEKDRNRKHRYS